MKRKEVFLLYIGKKGLLLFIVVFAVSGRVGAKRLYFIPDSVGEESRSEPPTRMDNFQGPTLRLSPTKEPLRIDTIFIRFRRGYATLDEKCEANQESLALLRALKGHLPDGVFIIGAASSEG